VRSRLGAARTILLLHTISARPSKEPRMVGSTLAVYSFALIFVSARTNKRHHHHHCAMPLSADLLDLLLSLARARSLSRTPALALPSEKHT
jgi:hypothetical protein